MTPGAAVSGDRVSAGGHANEESCHSPPEGARRVGTLSGDGYEAWVAGLDPETDAPRGRLRTDGQAVRFVEVVVNGPKSWSLAAELHPDIGAAYAAAQVMSALKQLDAVVEVLGWDEAFLGVQTSDPEALARAIQERVREATRLDCSVGIGHNRLQAKQATGFGKPAGVFRLTHENWFAVLGDKPTDALWGIGAKTARRLASLNIHTVAQLASADHDTLAAAIGPTLGPWLINLGRGVASAGVDDTPYIARSRSRETTFQKDLAD